MIEVWVTKKNIKVRVMIVHEDQTTKITTSPFTKMRSAQREITGRLKREGFKPVGRWVFEKPNEAVRVFGEKDIE